MLPSVLHRKIQLVGFSDQLNRLLPKFPQEISEKLHFQSLAYSEIAFFAISE